MSRKTENGLEHSLWTFAGPISTLELVSDDRSEMVPRSHMFTFTNCGRHRQRISPSGQSSKPLKQFPKSLTTTIPIVFTSGVA